MKRTDQRKASAPAVRATAAPKKTPISATYVKIEAIRVCIANSTIHGNGHDASMRVQVPFSTDGFAHP